MSYYLDIDFNKVEGFSKLSDRAKEIFKRVYRLHNAQQGSDYKELWIPVKVKERKWYLEVHFKNGGWMHYLPNGIWY